MSIVRASFENLAWSLHLRASGRIWLKEWRRRMVEDVLDKYKVEESKTEGFQRLRCFLEMEEGT